MENKLKIARREFLKDYSDAYEQGESYFTFVEIEKCNHPDKDCSECSEKNDCSNYRIKKIDAGLKFRCYDNLVEFDLGTSYDDVDNPVERAKENVKAINKFIETLTKFRMDYERAIGILKENIRAKT